MPTKPRLEAALELAALGFQIFPLHHPVEDGNGGLNCSCNKPDCQHPAKHPRWHKGDLPNGHLSATTDERQVRTWFTRWPQANIGILATENSGLMVLDIDPRNGGSESLERLTRLGSFPLTPETATGGGGEHYFFEYPRNGKIRPSSLKPHTAMHCSPTSQDRNLQPMFPSLAILSSGANTN